MVLRVPISAAAIDIDDIIPMLKVDERHQHGFYQVIAMMSVGDFIAAEFQCLIVQRTLAHFGT